MTEYNGNIKNLLQGVSQQARLERRPEQLEEQENCYSSVIKGLGNRPGTQILAYGTTTEYPSNGAYHSYDRGDTTERYSMTVRSGGIKVKDLLTGLDKTITGITTHASYLVSSDPERDFRFHTIADTTFLLNRSIEPEMETATASSDIWQAIIYCKRASWGFQYVVKSNGVTIANVTTASTVTLASGEQNKAITLETADVIDTIWNGANHGKVTWNSGYSGGVFAWATANGVDAYRFDDVIWLSHASTDQKITIEDANHGNDVLTFGQTIKKYDDLPRVCKDGYKVKITGLDATVYNNYYVEFEGEVGTDISQGVWVECAGFGVDTEFKASTMPHIITREASGDFLLQEVDWVARKAGDDNTNPKPSFIGTEISDILTYQGRLVLISEENAVASVTFDHYNFFAETVTQESDSDPIDTASSDNQVTNLHHSLVFNSSLVLFSDRAQFVHPGDRTFTLKNFGLSSKSRFKNIVSCAPVASATSIFFPYEAGLFTGIREMQVENVTGNVVVDDITSHVDSYIPGSAKQIVSSTDYNILIVRPGDDSTALYIFQWFEQEGKRKQAAWHKWDFGYPIRNIALMQDKLYIWKAIGSGVSIEYIDLADENTVGTDFPVRIDNMSIVAGVSDGDYWRIPTSNLTNTRGIAFEELKVLAGENTQTGGDTVTWKIHPTMTHTIRVLKSTVLLSTDPYFIFGTAISAFGTITNPYVRDMQNIPKTKGVLRLGAMKFNCTDTGELTIEVTKDNAPTYTKFYTNRIINSGVFILDTSPVLLDAEIKVAIRADANRCKVKFSSNSHLPFNIANIDWYGSYYETGRRTI